MKGFIGLMLALAVAAPPEAEVQGLYEGTLKEEKVEARVVALGKDAYKIYICQNPTNGKNTAELDGKADGDAVAFKNKGGTVEWTATYAPGLIKGTAGGVAFEFKRVQRKSPSMGKPAPEGAIVLLDGKKFDELSKGKAEEDWKPADDGSIQIPKGGMNSKRQFDGSYDLHVEFLCPLMPAARGQGRGNSGCYQANGDEVQVLDSFGMDTYKGGGWYWTSAALEEGTRLAAPNVLQWEAIKRLVAAGDRWYDTGKAAGDDAEPKARAISDFKRSMGGELRPLWTGRIDTAPISYRGLNALRGLRQAVRR
jgi:hypothetical protein